MQHWNTIRNFFLACFIICTGMHHARAQEVNQLLIRLKAKLDKVSDYVASGRLKTDVAFIKVPVAHVLIYYKKPDRFLIRKEGGIAILPRHGVNANLGSLLNEGEFAAVAAGESKLGATVVKIVKLIPLSENSDIVLTTLYIDEPGLLIRKAISTTKENGTYEIEMSYGKFADWGLPDKVIFSFNTKDYKLPKGLTFEYQDETGKPAPADSLKNRKGRVEIVYLSYLVNKGLEDTLFQ